MSRRFLLPLIPLYGAAQALNSLSYARGWRRASQLAWPVISVGNLSLGGAGKTPFVIALARMLSERGWAVDVLSRGYGRRSDAVERVVTEDAGDDPAARYGDEPWLIAQATQVPVFVGRERAQAGRLAERSLADAQGRHVHLLDDGMQHRRLRRDIEIVLLHSSDFAATLLPAGRLREPLASLERADFVVLRDEDDRLADRAVRDRVQRWMRADARIWQIRRRLVVPELPGPAVVFSAIAHPGEFAAELRTRGVHVAAIQAWRDHHRFSGDDLELLIRLGMQHNAACFLTTEKDDVRLTAGQRKRLKEATPLLTAKLSVELVDEEGVLSALEGNLRRAAEERDAL